MPGAGNTLPRPTSLLLAVLRAGLPTAAPGVTVVSELPAGWLDRLPLVHVSAGGGRGVGPNRAALVGAAWQLDAYATTSGAAHDLAASALQQLVAAWHTHTVYGGLVLTRLDDVIAPDEIREAGQPDSFARAQTSGVLSIR